MIQRHIAHEFLGYFFASALALALDTGIYVGALALGVPLAAAGALGFTAGVTCAYVICARLVFSVHRLRDRSSEFAVFVAIGTAGLFLTEALLWLFVLQLHVSPLLAKLATAALVFVFNFSVRRALLFSPTSTRGESDNRLEPLL